MAIDVWLFFDYLSAFYSSSGQAVKLAFCWGSSTATSIVAVGRMFTTWDVGVISHVQI